MASTPPRPQRSRRILPGDQKPIVRGLPLAAHVDVHGSTVALRRTDAALRAIGRPVVLSTTRASRIETAVAFSGSDSSSVYALGEHDGWHVWLRRARCA